MRGVEVLPVVLVLEGYEDAAESLLALCQLLFPELEFLVAADVQQTERLHNTHRDRIASVVVDDYHQDLKSLLGFIRRLRELRYGGDIVAHWGNPITREQMRAAGCNKVLPKPFEVKDLAELFGWKGPPPYNHYVQTPNEPAVAAAV